MSDRGGALPLPYIEAVIRSRAFSLVYQPIVDLDQGTISGAEALCRFNDGGGAEAWFEECERVGLAAELDLAIIEMALGELDQLPPGYLALNLSESTLLAAERLRSLLAPAVAQRQIVLELTEHHVVHDYPAVTAALAELRSTGVRLAVDDAGAGYSTFRHILRLRPEIIKLDRSITERIDEDDARRALAGALVMFAGDIGASVVAEGIETSGEMEGVRSVGIRTGQGFAIAMPHRLPLPPLDWQPVPYADLVAPPPLTSARGPEPPAGTAEELRTSIASLSSAVSRLGREDDPLDRGQLRALCTVMERQLAHAAAVLDILVSGDEGSSA